MNTIDPSALPWGQAYLAEDLAEVASNAIFGSSDRKTLKLQGLLQQGLVDATTATATGETLIVLAVRIDRSHAFEDLVLNFPEHRAQEFNQQDKNGDTLLHHIARHRSHEDFTPGVQAPWRWSLRNFLDGFGAKLSWDIRNHEDETALDLASRLKKNHLADVLKSYSANVTPS